MADLTTASNARRGARAWLTRAANALSTLLKTTSTDSAADPPTRQAFDSAIKEFDDRLRLFDDAQHALEALLDDEAFEKDLDQVGPMRENHMAMRVKAEEALQRLFPSDPPVTTPSVSADSADSASTFHVNAARSLPKLSLPSYSGDVMEWQGFWDRFDVDVNSRDDLEKVQKFSYLRSCLSGEAYAAIDGLHLTNAHYDDAVALLKSRFGRTTLVVVAHVQALLQLESVTSSSASKLRALFNRIQKHVRSLQALQVTGDQYGIFLVPIILSKLPHALRMEWLRDSAKKESDLAALLAFYERELTRREMASAYEKEKPAQPPTKPTKRNPPTAAALSAPVSSRQTCAFCQDSAHRTWKCPQLLSASPPAREELIKDACLCRVCLKSGHLPSKCNFKCHRCQGRHNLVLCPEKTPAVASLVADAALSSLAALASGATVLQTARIRLQTDSGIVLATALFDSGSDRSYATSSLVQKCSPSLVSHVSLQFASFACHSPNAKQCALYTFNVYDANDSVFALNAFEIPVICPPMHSSLVSPSLLSTLHPWADDYGSNRDVQVDLLIGLDLYWRLLSGPVRHLQPGLVAQHSVFGWVLSGSNSSNTSPISSQLLCLSNTPESLVRSMWELDSIGIKDSGSAPLDDPVLKAFNDSISFDGCRYSVALPWKDSFLNGSLDLESNLSSALSRHHSLTRRLSRDSVLSAEYSRVFSSLEEDGVICPVDSGLESVNPIFYLPHRPVVKESSSSTRVRPVFDASAAGPNGVSLNDCLEPGPSLIPNLVEVLCRFRRWKIALSADITKAFLQIGLHESDRDVHRFLLPSSDGSPRVMRFNRVTFGVASSPFLLNATIAHHLSKYPPSQRAVHELKHNLYVDDWLTGADTLDDVLSLFNDGRSIMLDAGMTLCKWTSSSAVASLAFPPVEGQLSSVDLCKVLGVQWCPFDDAFTFQIVSVLPCVLTKRSLLGVIARIFDPIGLIAPVLMEAKILFQQLWTLGVSWDDPVPDDFQQQISLWLADLQSLSSFKLPRPFFPDGWDPARVVIHVFADASEKGYGACAYIAVAGQVSLVTSRARVAPLKKLTLPRLELMACLVAARLLLHVRSVLELPDDTPYVCWSDSMVALGWLQGNPSRWKQFIANRVREIQDLTNPAMWRHCPGMENPADALTRGMLARDLISLDLWWHGPSELLSDDCRKDAPLVDLQAVVLSVCELSLVSLSYVPLDVLPFSNFHSLTRLQRVVAWILRFRSNSVSPSPLRNTGPLSDKELHSALLLLLRHVQELHFSSELSSLRAGQSVPKSSKLFSLSPFLADDGLLRIKGRLEKSLLPYEEKHSVILPKCLFSSLLVCHLHHEMKHAGVASLMVHVRARFWIIGLRSIAKRVKHECVICQRYDSKLSCQPAAPLPAERVREAPPFSVVGLDFAGPLFCSDLRGKKYFLIFTCAVTRAVHLELTSSMSLSEFLLAFRRFSSRRGLPSTVFSDNAPTFHAASSRLSELFSSPPEWRFIAPCSPWWGGWWERLVSSVKSGLRKALGRGRVSRSELETLLFEVESCINSRPLTYVSDLPGDGVLTPSHFLLGKLAMSQVPISDLPSPLAPGDLSALFLHQSEKLRLFWDQWTHQYLKSLPCVVSKFKSRGVISVGSIVLIKDDNMQRFHWPLGKVEEVLPGRDGLVRAVRVKTSKGVYVRPIQRLLALELPSSPLEELSLVPDSGDLSARPRRSVRPPSRLDL